MRDRARKAPNTEKPRTDTSLLNATKPEEEMKTSSLLHKIKEKGARTHSAMHTNATGHNNKN